MNRVILVGRITKDPEIKSTQSNIAVVTFIQCVVWRKQAENLARFVRKGALLGVEGRIQTRQYEADNGTRYVTEVVCDSVQFLESKGDTTEQPVREEQNTSENDEFYETSKQLAAEEDLPF